MKNQNPQESSFLSKNKFGFIVTGLTLALFIFSCSDSENVAADYQKTMAASADASGVVTPSTSPTGSVSPTGSSPSPSAPSPTSQSPGPMTQSPSAPAPAAPTAMTPTAMSPTAMAPAPASPAPATGPNVATGNKLLENCAGCHPGAGPQLTKSYTASKIIAASSKSIHASLKNMNPSPFSAENAAHIAAALSAK